MKDGKLLYFMGPSGSGKDSVLSGLKGQLQSDKKWFFSRRYITRNVKEGDEKHIPLIPSRFEELKSRGFFALDWKSHGFAYGIDKGINQQLEAKKNVIVSGSREYLSTAIDTYPDLLPIIITASPDTLAKRLTNRGRENKIQIKARLQRAGRFLIDHPNLITICNETNLSAAVNELYQKLTNLH
ncbi:MAG: phosphonate metabolism protein/1,5-bisphosphokinase (PRPP-forming) PhnN [Desulfotalea sp.]